MKAYLFCLFVVCFWRFCRFLFFKQKTAYDMRISDLSSDVCSSDLKTDNGYLIDTSELFRVFPPKQKETVAESRSETPSGNSEKIGKESCRERVCKYG